jgi:hypothetical protein
MIYFRVSTFTINLKITDLFNINTEIKTTKSITEKLTGGWKGTE